MSLIFTSALFLGSAALGVWIAVRFPRLAPASVIWRGLIPIAVAEALSFAPIYTDTYVDLYCSIFLVLVPLLTVMWLGAVWLLLALRDAVGAG